MDVRSPAILLAFALASTALAGCIQNPDWLNRADVETTAAEQRALADAAAASWSEGAELIGILGIETREQVDPRIDADPEVGNGRAPAWWYVYCADETTQETTTEASATRDGEETTAYASMPMVRAFKVTADGAVSSEQDAETMAAGFSHEMAEAVGEWTLDSDAALTVAKGDDGFRAAAEGMNATLLEGLARHDGRTAWWFAAASASGMVVATVDALTGELVDVRPLDFKMPVPSFEMAAQDPAHWIPEPIHLEGEGVAASGDMPFELPFSTTGPMYGTMLIDHMAEFPTDGLHWAVLDADGEIVAVDHVGGWRGAYEYEGEVHIEDAGDYTLVIEYMSSAPLPVPTPGIGSVTYAFSLDLVGDLPVDEDEEES